MHPIRRRRNLILGASGITYDVDAQVYYDAVIANSGALLTLEKGAYNVYRIDAKNNAIGAWNGDAHVDYPMLGSTVESCVINAHNPGTFDATAVNTVAGDFTANGFTPNGSDSYFRTGLIPSVVLGVNSATLEYYSRDNTLNEATFEFSAFVNATSAFDLGMEYSVAVGTFFDAWGSSDRVAVIIGNAQGGFTGSRIANNDARIYRNGIQQNINTLTLTQTRPNIEIYLGCRNNAGTAGDFSSKENAGAGIFDGLTPAKVLAQYNARQLLNTNCVSGGRQV